MHLFLTMVSEMEPLTYNLVVPEGINSFTITNDATSGSPAGAIYEVSINGDIVNVTNADCDIDNDGIINSLDLDSDNDGCSDAV